MRTFHSNNLLGAALVAACFTCVAPAQAQFAEFDMTNNLLTLDTVSVGGQSFYTGVALALPPAQAWSIQPGARQISPLSSSNVANYANGQLTLPRTTIGNATYDGFILNLPVGAPMSIARMGSISSANSPGYTSVAFPIRSRIKNSYETDAVGELTYVLTNGQVWKHFIDEPCMPSGIGTTDPDGFSDVEIYQNPGGSGSVAANEGNYRFVNFYPSKAEALRVETCLVTPVSGIFGVNEGPSLNDLAVSPIAINGAPNAIYNLNITGGSPPYLVVASVPGVTNFSFQSNASFPTAAELRIELASVGSTDLTVYDINRSFKVVPVTVTMAGGAFFYPPSIDGFNVGTEMDLFILFGNPPYSIMNPLAGYIEVTPVGDVNTTRQYRLRLVSMPPAGATLNVGVRVTDVQGTSAEFGIKNFQDNPLNTLPLSMMPSAVIMAPSLTEYVIGISGGHPPYTAHNPNSNVFDVQMLDSNMFKVSVKSNANVWSITNPISLILTDSWGAMTTLPITFTGYEGGGYTQYR